MSLSPAFLDELRARVPVSGVVGRRVKLTRAGREMKGCCPFHNEKSPSFYVNDEKGFYHCFGCGAHGDVIRFMTDNMGLPFMEAVKPFELTRMETQACINTPPSSIVEVHLLVEECEERLDQDRVRELLVLCHRTLVPPVSAEPEAADASGGAAATSTSRFPRAPGVGAESGGLAPPRPCTAPRSRVGEKNE